MSANPYRNDKVLPFTSAIEPPKVVQRADPDKSQNIRRGVQIAFLLLNVYIGVKFFAWVRAMETGAPAMPRPSGVEGWLPIAALMNLKAWILTGNVPAIHPAGMFLLVSFLGMSLLLKKAFCSWLCPVGTISEYLGKLGRKIFRRNLLLPKWVDIPLRGPKYLLLSFFLYAVAIMPAAEIAAFMQAPYGMIADVKLLNFFRFMSGTALVVVAVIAILSVVIQNFWCRYLCPYGALLGLVAIFSPTRIRRDADACIDCAKCTKACPSRLPVGVISEVISPECTLCMTCVAVCPVKDALRAKVTPKRAVSPWAVAATIAVLFLGIVLVAKLAGHWDSNVPESIYRALVVNAAGVLH